MTLDAPRIDSRDQQMLVDLVRKLALYYCPEWKDIASIESDENADALIYIFSRMMEIIIQRLNKVPEKNFLAFLDMVGVLLSPPRVARAPLTFNMAKGGKQYGFIQAGTQVATEQTKEKEAVIFETSEDLTVIQPMLVGAVSLIPYEDKWANHSPALFNDSKEVLLFNGQELVPHRLYLGPTELFGFKEETAITLDIELPETANPLVNQQEWEVKWYYFDENSNPKLLPVDETLTSDAVANLLENGKIKFKPVSGISTKTLTGFEKETGQKKNWTSNWIYAELKTPIPERLSEITAIHAVLNIAPASAAAPDMAFFNNIAIDLTKDFYPFGERPKFNDTFYIGSKEAFSKEKAVITIEVTLSDGVDPPAPGIITLVWEYWDGKSWGTIYKTGKQGVDGEQGDFKFSDSTKAFTSKGSVIFTCPKIEKKEINGQENYWIRVRIIEGNYGKDASYEAISIDAGNGQGKITSSGMVVTGDGTDFKNQLSVGDSITASGETKIITGITNASSLIVDSAFKSDLRAAAYSIKKIGWIYKPLTFKPPSINKLTLNYTFDLESDLQTILSYNDFSYQVFVYYLFNWDEVPGNDSVRLIDFLIQNYDVNWVKNAKIEKSGDKTSIKISDGKNSISLELDSTKQKVNLKINGISTKDFFVKTENGKTNIYDQNKTSFNPFQPVEDEQPALYLAFDQDISTLPVTLFFPLLENVPEVVNLEFENNGPASGVSGVILNDVSDLQKGDAVEFQNPAGETEQKTITRVDKRSGTIYWDGGLTKDFSAKDSTIALLNVPPVLAWEYWTGKNWSLLSVEDGTMNLTEREIVQFLAPGDLEQRHCFDFETGLYWIRAKLYKGKYNALPKLKGIYTNTVWAYNRVTVKVDILGSSNGKTNQVFNFSIFPVLPGQEVWVRELSLTEWEKNAVLSEEGKDAIEEIKDDANNIIGFWVRWHEKSHLYSSDPHSRHYVIDRNKGTIIFGDGERGMIPPAGKDNIKCSYKAGGGATGNVKAGTITKLRTALPYVDLVTNPEDADGGGDKEEMDKIIERGPQTLKHRDRAVTYEDFVWLVKEASPKVVKVKCLPTTDISLQNQPGWVTLIIVPESDDPKPVPSQQLISEIESYIFERTSTYLASYPSHPSQINLIGPGYLKVWVEASVQLVSISEAKTIEGRIIDTLNQFFHPLYGGPEKKGWDFGRNVYISEVYAAIENTDGVDYVETLNLNVSAQMYKMSLETIRLPLSYPEKSIVKSTSDDRIEFYLAKSLPKETDINMINVTGFKEGDSIILRNADKSVNLVIKSVSHNILCDVLECESVWIENSFPKNSTVETSNKNIKSFILNEIPAQSDISLTPIQVAILEAADNIALIHRDNPLENISGKITGIDSNVDTIFIDNNYLVYSGTHVINKKENRLVFPYLIDASTNIIHDLTNIKPDCHINDIQKDNRIFVKTIEATEKKCPYCLGAD